MVHIMVYGTDDNVSLVEYGLVYFWCDAMWCDLVWCGLVWCGIVLYGKVWHSMIWYGMVWHGIAWHSIIWYGTLSTVYDVSCSFHPHLGHCSTEVTLAEDCNSGVKIGSPISNEPS